MSKKKKEHYCLNCNAPITFKSNAVICDICFWQNELKDKPSIQPITLKSKTLEKSFQICYPLVEEADLEGLPPKLKDAITAYFKSPEQFNRKMYFNIYHNMYVKDPLEYERSAKKLTNKAKLVWFFQHTNFLKTTKKYKS